MTPASSTAQRMIAERLAAAADHELSMLFAVHRISPGANPATSWHDLFDVAETFLHADHVAMALSRAHRDLLADLASGTPRRTLTLTDDAGLALPSVAARLAQENISRAETSSPAPADATAAAHAAERAFTTLTALADIVIATLTKPLVRVGSGSLSAVERRRLADERVAGSPEEADLLVRLASATGLLHAQDRRIGATDDGSAWVRLSTAERWSMLATRLRDALPRGLRDGRGWIDTKSWPGAYPLDPAWPAEAETWLAFARLVGLIADAHAEPAWAAPIRRGEDPDPAPLTALMPGEVDRVFLQNDLTAISPGLLEPALDVRLRGMTTRESHAQASAYRFTEGSITRALSTGETSDGMREFLAELSLTGIPQPLEYLIGRSADRHGLVRVAEDPATGRTVVSSPERDLLRTLEVDRAIGGLGLSASGDALVSRASRDVVFWALTDARYPAIALNDDGSVAHAERHGVVASGDDDDAYAGLIARLRDAHGEGSDRAWLERELDAAIREKTALVVAIRMPDGSERELTLEPTGLGGGRLRGRDAAAEVERTLPVGLIASVRPL
ncbi:helicase-associated domain-containing protein [Microbacterium gubbeenense]|uniref:helicase-associated domain-containing protein n=1 Tax=Microbacterium gubbeenense TaxID=159896 RepID=UPI003F9810C6